MACQGADTGGRREAFRFYVVQDAHYLREYARALSVAAARAPTEAVACRRRAD